MKTTVCKMDSSGDTRLEFESTDLESAARMEAEALFKRVTGNGGRAFRTGAGDKDGIIKSFDQVEGEVVLVPRIAGG